MTDLDLAAIRERVEQATEGPWAAWYDQDGQPHMQGRLMVGNADAVIPDGKSWVEGVDINPVAECLIPEDREFIAHAREDVPALLDALQAVRELHKPRPNSTSALHPTPLCSCGTEYPCPTIQALDSD